MAESDLCTFEQVEAWLNPPSLDSDADTIRRLITAASDFIHRYCGRYLLSHDYEELRDGTGGMVMMTASYPITQVTLVSVNDIVIPPAPTTLTAGYMFNDTAIALRNYRFSRGNLNVVLSYTAGYATVPDELTQAAIELVTERYRERGREGVVQENVTGISSTTFRPVDMTLSIKAGLAPFRKVAPIASSSWRFSPPPGPPI
jgi:hypothetical protein